MTTASPAVTYSPHGTANVAIVLCPAIAANRLLHLSQKGEYSWALRDYITGKILRSGDSEMTLSEVEARVTYSGRCAYRSVSRINEWKQELIASSQREFGAKYDPNTPPSSRAGSWKQL